jgi:MFS family permease
MSDGVGGRNLGLFLAGNVCFGAGLIVHAFAYNFYLRDLGFAPATMGDQVSAMTLGGLAALLPAGWATDRLGAKQLMAIGVVVCTIGLVLGGLVRDRATMLAAAAVVGAGGATCRVTWSPALMRLTTTANRARAFTWNVALLMASAAAGNAVAGSAPQWFAAVGAPFGVSGTQIALIGSALVTLCALPCYLAIRLERSEAPTHAVPRALGSVSALTVPRSAAIALAAVTAWMLTDAIVQPFLNILFTDRFAMSVASVGSLFGAALALRAVALIGAAETARRWGPWPALVLWIAISVPSFAIIAATHAASVAIGAFMIIGFLGPATNPLIDQLMLERIPVDRHGAVASWRNIGAEATGAVGAAVGGRVLEASSFPMLFVGAAVIGVLTAPLLLIVLRPPRPA